MSENSNYGAEGVDLNDSESGLATLGLAETAAEHSAVEQPAAPHIAVPLTRRELRAQEKAALEHVVPEQAVAPSQAQQVAPAESPVPLTPVSDAWSVQASAATSFGVESLPVEVAKQAPKKPKTFKSVRVPRGMSRPSATTRPRSSTSRSRPKSFKRQLLSKLMTFGAMIGAGLMMVSTSIPANAFYPVEVATGTVAVTAAKEVAEVQSVSVQSVGERTLSRDGYTAVSLRERLFLEFGNRNWSYSNNPNGTIQWPFPIAVPISSGFGQRIAPCGACSSFHEGLDFTPGGGTAIQAVADGVVSQAADDAWGLGSHVIIDHRINGQLVQTVYGHMQRGSIRLTLGQEVKVTDIVGLVGSTGISTGNHLHFEIHVNGVQVDPFDWLKANAN